MSILGRLWRTLATLLCFSTFAVGGLCIGAFILPAVRLLRRRDEDRHRAGRRVIHVAFHLFVTLMRATGVLRVRFVGLDRLRRHGQLVLANHPTLIDFVLLASVIPQADCFVKSDLKADWFKRWPVLLAGYILNNQGETTMDLCRRSLGLGNNIIIFPEGTRTPPGAPVRFRQGAAQVAVRIGQDITPIFIESTPSNLHKGGTWYLAPAEPVEITLRVEEPIRVRPFLVRRPDQPALAARDLNDHLQDYFNKGLVSARA